jgi:hypothetical protein
MDELPTAIQLDEDGDICDSEGRHLILFQSNLAFARAIVQRYNTHTAREQTLADVAELVSQLARSLTNYNEAYALARQMRAVLKKAREG